jgi:hypothetical protein
MIKPVIYGLWDPSLETCHYVGYSINPSARLKEHMDTCATEKNAKSAWLYELKLRKWTPRLVILEELELDDDWEVKEREWIAHMRASGFPLLNEVAGGLGTTDPSPRIREASARGGKQNAGKQLSEETKQRISEGMKER